MRPLPLVSLLAACAASGGDDKPGDPTTAGTAVGSPGGTPGGTTTPTTPAPLAAPVCDLLVNPGAEAGTTGWSVVVGELVAAADGAGAPTPWEGAAQFGMGTAATTIAAQTVDLAPWGPAVAFGTVVAHLDVQLRGVAGSDEAFAGLTARDADGNPLGEVLAGPYTDEAWRLRRLHLAVPAGTASLEVRFGGTRHDGSTNDAWADALSLCLDTEIVPELPALAAGPWLTWLEPDAVTVHWETDTVVQGSVEVGRAGVGWEQVVDEGAATDHHQVRLQGLLPDTTYDYRVRFGDQVGDTWSFRTAPDAAVPFRFTVWGDNQDGPEIFAELVDRMEGLDPDFAVSVGDVVQFGAESNWRNELLDPIVDLAVDTPFLVASGNHERYGDVDASNFERHLDQPGDEHCFGWTYGGVYFLFLDTEDPVDSGPQADCIAAQLASPEFAAADVQIALFHYPPRIEYWAFFTFDGIPLYTGDPEVRDVLEPQFEAAGVDLVLNGHNHLYAYTAAGAYSSVAWVTTGGGGGALDTAGWDVGDWNIDTTVFENHVLLVEVDGSVVDVTAVGVDGSVLHQFEVIAD